MQPGAAVGADGGQEPEPDAELVQQSAAGLGQVGPAALELPPGQHGRTLRHRARVVKGGVDRLTSRCRRFLTAYGRWAVFSHTDTWALLSLVKGVRAQSLQRSRKVIPASRAMRSSSDGQT